MTAEQQVIEHGAHAVEIREQDDRRAMIVMDRMDLDQAVAELRGDVVATFVYVAKGKRQLSYAGIKEAARLYKNVDFGATAQPLPDGSWMLTSYAHNLADNTRVSLPMPYPAFNPGDPGQSIDYRATLSKSVRNALAAVLPVAYLTAMIDRWIKDQQGGGRNVAPARSADPQIATQRARLAELLGRFPDAAAAIGDRVLPDHLVAGAVSKLEARLAAVPRRSSLPPTPDPIPDVEASPEDQLASAYQLARTALDHVSAKKGGPTVDDLTAMRDILAELQRLSPREDDVPPRDVPGKALVFAIASRLPSSNPSPAADDDVPF